ncbi:uncharacterized protein LOC143914309 [Arctopsyche grandis]|uniref:uncharacterized protein LOC143914309 n=1 Tax=Arctopsyche grandis TaxID=121162 RepID=UPI00406D6572
MAGGLLLSFQMRNCFTYKVLNFVKIHTKPPYRMKNCIEYDSKYSKEEESKILTFLNKSEPNDILRLSMSQMKLKRILSRRSNKGNFGSFSDILEVDGLGVKMMEKMCDSILTFDPNQKIVLQSEGLKKKLRGQVLEPILTRSNLNSIKTATSLYIHDSIVGWAQIEKNPFRLTNWNLYEIPGDDDKKLQLSEIMNIVWDILNSLPKSDVYIMEAVPTMLKSVGADSKNPKAVHVNLQRTQLIAALSAMINADGNLQKIDRDDEEDLSDGFKKFEHKVLYLRATLASRLFKTIVGNEKVSAESTVSNIIDQSSEIDLDCVKTLNVLESLKHFYFKQKIVNREMLSQTLLIILTFYEICLFENQKAIQKLYCGDN